jgi:hypothetical protein
VGGDDRDTGREAADHLAIAADIGRGRRLHAVGDYEEVDAGADQVAAVSRAIA